MRQAGRAIGVWDARKTRSIRGGFTLENLFYPGDQGIPSSLLSTSETDPLNLVVWF